MPKWNVAILGNSLSLPAHEWVGARATSFLAAHFAKQNTNSVGVQSEGEAEGVGGSASPERQNSASGFSQKKVRISFRIRSNLTIAQKCAIVLVSWRLYQNFIRLSLIGDLASCLCGFLNRQLSAAVLILRQKKRSRPL